VLPVESVRPVVTGPVQCTSRGALGCSVDAAGRAPQHPPAGRSARFEVVTVMVTRRPLREPVSVSDDRRTTVRGKLTHQVKGSASYAVGHDRAVEIGGDDRLKVGGERGAEIGGDDTLRVARNRTASIGKDDRQSVAGKLLIDAGDEVT